MHNCVIVGSILILRYSSSSVKNREVKIGVSNNIVKFLGAVAGDTTIARVCILSPLTFFVLNLLLLLAFRFMSDDKYNFRLQWIREFCREFRMKDVESSPQETPEEKVNPYHLFQ